jgi:murein DD-endopeptidase MepM/ murein hydrolase activator NlpD
MNHMSASKGQLRRVWTAVGLTAAFIALAVSPASSNHSLEHIEKRQRALEERDRFFAQRQGGLEETVAYLDRRATKVQGQVDALDAQLADLDAKIKVTEEELTEKQQRLTFVTDQLQDVQGDLVEQTDVFSARAVAIYKAGPGAYLDSFLSARTFSDFIDRAAYYEAALDSDADLLESIENLRDSTDIRRTLVEDAKNEVAEKKLSLEADRQAVASVRAERGAVLDIRKNLLNSKQEVLARVRGNRAQIAAIQTQLREDRNEITALLSGSISGDFPVGGGQLLWPADGPVTSGFGYRTHPIFGDTRFHSGIDIGAGYGAPVIASDAGSVVFVGAMSGYGNVIVVDHGGGLATTYNHLSGFYVSEGQGVGRGALIGAVGCTGYCTGPHLHFEVRVNGSPVDPMPYLQ